MESKLPAQPKLKSCEAPLLVNILKILVELKTLCINVSCGKILNEIQFHPLFSNKCCDCKVGDGGDSGNNGGDVLGGDGSGGEGDGGSEGEGDGGDG